jgi:hypothetical protein
MARRTLVAALTALAALITATSAYAHAGNPNFESLVQGVSPAIPGFSVQVLNGDDRLEVVNRSTKTITIDGYNEEPYLRMSPDGTVAVNLRSPAYYLNQDRLNLPNAPASANPKLPPQWKVVEHTGRYQFHDHRMHWMSTTTPSQVKNTSKRTKIFNWKVPVHAGTTTASINGELFWRGSSGGPPAAAFIGLLVIVLLGAASVVVIRRRRAGEGEGGGGGGAPAAVGPSGEAW